MRRPRSEINSRVVKPSRFLFTLVLTAAMAAWLRADDGVLPKGPAATRYDAMAARSPFTAPTVALPAATPPPVAAGPHWWDQMFLTSLMDRGGVYYIGLVDRASNKHYLLATGKTDEDSQLLLTSVQWNDRLDQTTAMVSKGAEAAPPIRFDATAASAAPVSPAQPSFSAPRPLPNALPPTLPPGFTGTPPPPPPTGNPVVRRNAPIASRPGAAPQTPTRPGAQPPANGPRRIIVPNGDD